VAYHLQSGLVLGMVLVSGCSNGNLAKAEMVLFGK